MSYLKIMKAVTLPGYLVSCLDMDDLFRYPFPSCDIAILDREYDSTEDAENNAGPWFGVKEIDTGFDSINLCLIADYYGGECGQYLELYEEQEVSNAEQNIWNMLVRMFDYGGYKLKYNDFLIVRFCDVFASQHFDRMFASYLDLTGFELAKMKDGFALIDLQNVNLGNIEEERFENAGEIIDRMDWYIEDYLGCPIARDVFGYGDVDMPLGELAQKAICNVKHSCGDYEDVLDVLCSHGDEINLDNVLSIMKGDK